MDARRAAIILAAGASQRMGTPKALLAWGRYDVALAAILINRLLDGFEGKLTSSKWAALAKCSQDTAHRDIVDLVERGLLLRNPGGGRSTSYSLKAS